MGYARNIGRLGALAVALGVGYGVADMPAAFADDSAASDSGSSSPARASRGHAASSDADSGSTRAAGHRGAVTTAPDAVSASAADSALADIPSIPVVGVKSDPVNNDAPPASAAAVSAPSPSAAVNSAPAPSAAVNASTSAAVNVGSATAQPAPAASTPAPAATTVNVVAPAAAVVSAPVTQTAPAAAAPKPAATIASLVSAALSPLLGDGTGDAPGQSPLLFGVLAWARKELERITGITSPAAVTTTGQTQSPNLLVNPGAEESTADLSGYSSVSMPGWTWTGTPTVIKYDTPRIIWSVGMPFAWPALPSIWSFPKAKNGPSDGGNQFFGGGNVADATLSQRVDLSAAGAAIDGGNVSYNLGAWLGGYSFDPSAASVKVTFLDTDKTYLGTAQIGPVTAWDRLFAINLLQRSTTGTLPVGTRYADVEVFLDDQSPIKYGISADYNNAFADNISFTIGASLPAPGPATPIASAPPALDHVYMVYMENKGYTNIVGSPNAPYLNSLIENYGFADNFYALTHGSLPNYYAVIGGETHGKTYNCGTPCIDAPLSATLPGLIDAAGKTWRSYAQGLTAGANPLEDSGDYAFDATGFPAYEAIAQDPAYAKAHIVPLEQMKVDLQSKDTAPNFAWFAADENFNGEGPVSGLSGALKFALNQLDPKHQYNVPALDQYLSETVPTILDSPVWNDPTQKSVIVVTFDEDNNNTSLGFGNEGNHIVTVVIPSPGAIAAGWKGGAFTATNYYSLYSVQRLIEDSLGLGSLTNNDKFAPPMNEFWTNGNKSGAGSVV